MDKTDFKKRVLFIGVPDMAFVGLDTLLYAGINIVGVIGPKKTHNTYYIFKEFVKSRHQHFIEYDKLSSPELIAEIKALKVDIAVVCSFNNIIPKVFIDAIKDGILNVHPSLLPKYRGGNPYSWVIINNEKETGVTIHYISEDLDKGDIVYQQKVPISKDETMGTLFYRTNNLGCRMLLQALITYEKTGTLPRQKQPEGDFIKAPNIKDEELIIDFNKPAEYIERFIRSVNPFLNPVTFYANEGMKIHKVSVIEKDYSGFLPGQICDIKENKVYIQTGKGCIIPEIIHYSGIFIGDCSDFISILKPKIGDKFNNDYT